MKMGKTAQGRFEDRIRELTDDIIRQYLELHSNRDATGLRR